MEKPFKINNPIMRLINNIQSKPARMIALSFLFVIFIGTILLSLSFSTIEGKSPGLLKALFTATSATCVTGLVLVDTATYWSIFGQIVILVLIQIGGLGLVTITTFFFTLLKRKMGIRTLAIAQESTASFTLHDVRKLLIKIVVFTLSFESIGAVVFAIRFIPTFGWKNGIYRSIFHSVSSFCNAGFDLMGTFSGKFSSLTAWSNDSIVVLMTAFMLISGGIGFIVWSDIFNFNKIKGLNFHSKLVLRVTLILLFSGTLFIFFSEFSNVSSDSMTNFTIWRKLESAFFQSATTRTAGFNTVAQSSMNESSKIGSILLMFIGASPGSTGGGIKITTIAIIFSYIFSQMRGYKDTLILKKKIESSIVSKSIIIFFIALVLITADTAIMSVLERSAINAGNISTLDLLFESVSAFSTVGLSSASTPDLHLGSHILLILTMFIGRIGPVAFAFAITERSFKDKGKIFPEAKIHVG